VTVTASAQPSSLPSPFGLAPGGFLLVVSGPSGAGKGTLVQRLMLARPDCVFAVSSTTRPMREGETEGVQYRFVSREQFEKQREQGYFLEWAEVHDNLYGTPLEQVNTEIAKGRVIVLDIDVQGGASVRAKRPDAVTVFVAPPSLDVLRARLEGRGTDSRGVIETRMGNAPGELAQYVHYDYLVLNDDLDGATAHLVAIHDAERARVRRLAPRT
jgi:guanylate kinase